jgi:hypothetical protein
MMHRFIIFIALLGAALLSWAPAAHGRQFLISEGEDWSSVADDAKPGDEIILMPGTHVAVKLSNLHGTDKAPITIRGLDEAHPVTIEAKRAGLELVNPQFVVVQDVVITGATINGLVIDTAPVRKPDKAPGEDEADAPAAPTGPRHVTLRRVRIEKTGPEGLRHALTATGVESLQLEHCAFDGWGGCAVELRACQNVSIEHCTFAGRDDHSQMWGIRARSNCDLIKIDHCTFTKAAATCIQFGGKTEIDELVLPAESVPEPASMFQTSRSSIQHCLFVDSFCPVHFGNVDGITMRYNTVVRPQPWIISVVDDDDPTVLAPSRNILIGENIFVFDPATLTRLSNIGLAADTMPLRLEENLWWAGEPYDVNSTLGMPPGEHVLPQTLDVDPKLDEKHLPTTEAAQSLGYGVP